jgi:hypothetical protein
MKVLSKIVFKSIFSYNLGMKSESTLAHPATIWEQDARQLPQSPQLRLASMAGHMRIDRIAARRAALIDLLADGRPHVREEIWQAVAGRLGADCWGKLPQEGLARDLVALRKGGIRIAYSRRPAATGYYLQHPRLVRPLRKRFDAINWELVRQIGQLSVPEKNERSFAAADFSLTQKRLILAEENPGWTSDKVERVARRMVFGPSEATRFEGV